MTKWSIFQWLLCTIFLCTELASSADKLSSSFQVSKEDGMWKVESHSNYYVAGLIPDQYPIRFLEAVAVSLSNVKNCDDLEVYRELPIYLGNMVRRRLLNQLSSATFLASAQNYLFSAPSCVKPSYAGISLSASNELQPELEYCSGGDDSTVYLSVNGTTKTLSLSMTGEDFTTTCGSYKVGSSKHKIDLSTVSGNYDAGDITMFFELIELHNKTFQQRQESKEEQQTNEVTRKKSPVLFGKYFMRISVAGKYYHVQHQDKGFGSPFEGFIAPFKERLMLSPYSPIINGMLVWSHVSENQGVHQVHMTIISSEAAAIIHKINPGSNKYQQKGGSQRITISVSTVIMIACLHQSLL